jgi:undecaprenol kinase (EC 2.7.1.66)
MGGLRQSFAWALNGLGYVLRTQRNMKIHLVMAGLAVAGGVFFKITRGEWGRVNSNYFPGPNCRNGQHGP